MFCFELARIGGYKNHQYYNRLKTYETSGTKRDFYVMGQDKLVIFIMSQNIFLSPSVSRSEFHLCLKTI